MGITVEFRVRGCNSKCTYVVQALNTAEDQARSLAHWLKRMVVSSLVSPEEFLNRLNTGGFRPVPACASSELHSVDVAHRLSDRLLAQGQAPRYLLRRGTLQALQRAVRSSTL